MRAVCHREEETYPIVFSGCKALNDERPAWVCLTAMPSDMFEANGLSNHTRAWRKPCDPAEGWVLIMRAIKCLKGIRWMPWR